MYWRWWRSGTTTSSTTVQLAQTLVDWKARQVPSGRVSVPQPVQDAEHYRHVEQLFNQRPRLNNDNRPKPRLIPVEPNPKD